MPNAVVLTASAGALPGLVDALRAIPVEVEECPLLSFALPESWASVDRALEALSRFEAVALTSPRAAYAFTERLESRGLGAQLRDRGTKVWVGGAGTAAVIGGKLGPIVRPAEVASGEVGAAAALADAMVAAGIRGPVLFPCGEIRRDELPARLRAAGIEVEEVVCYRSVLAAESAARVAAGRARVLVVASPSVAGLLARACPAGDRPALLAVGPTTAQTARASGWPPDAVATRPSADAVAVSVRELLDSK